MPPKLYKGEGGGASDKMPIQNFFLLKNVSKKCSKKLLIGGARTNV